MGVAVTVVGLGLFGLAGLYCGIVSRFFDRLFSQMHYPRNQTPCPLRSSRRFCIKMTWGGEVGGGGGLKVGLHCLSQEGYDDSEWTRYANTLCLLARGAHYTTGAILSVGYESSLCCQQFFTS